MKPPKSIETSSPFTVAWARNRGVIYFIAAGQSPKAIKIGMTTITGKRGKRDLRDTIMSRLRQIQSSNHELIHLLGVIEYNDGTYPAHEADARERDLHNEFQHLRRFKEYSRGEEWFEAADELLKYIEQNATKPQDLNLPLSVAEVAPRS